MGSLSLDADEWRNYAHVPETPTVGQADPDQWLNWGDHTVTVDPIMYDQWITDGTHERHQNGMARQRRLDGALVKQLQQWTGEHHLKEWNYFTPSQQQMAGLDKFTARMGSGCRTYRGVTRDPSRFGKLPSVIAELYDGKFPHKSSGDIDHEVREAMRDHQARVFSRSDELLLNAMVKASNSAG